MGRERKFAILLALALPCFIALSLEVLVRTVVDDGKQLDLEMWDYARHAKRRAADPAVGHEHRPGVRIDLMGVAVAINDRKLRERDIPFEKDRSTLRILMLGDSLTFGWGVPAEKTVAKRLEALINATGARAEVVNAGVGNYNTSMEVAYYLAEGHRYMPDLVLLNYFINDAEQTPAYDALPLARWSAAYVYLSSRIDVLLRLLQVGSRRDWKSYLADLYDPSNPASGWSGVKGAFTDLAEAAGRHGSRAIVVDLPELRQLRPYPFQKEAAQVRVLAESLGLPYIDLLPAVADREPSRLWVTALDPHPNELAHELFASALFDALRSSDLLRAHREPPGSKDAIDGAANRAPFDADPHPALD